MTVHFILKRSGWGWDDIYEAIKTGKKTSEWRDSSDFWKKRLLTESGIWNLNRAITMEDRLRSKPPFMMDFPSYQWKHKNVRFVVGYTSYPRLIADIEAILYYSKTSQFEIKIMNVVEELG